MKNNTKSSITLPNRELRLVLLLMKQTGSKSKVEVIRKGLEKLRESVERDLLKAKFVTAAKATREITLEEMKELDSLSSEGFDKAKK